MSLFAISATATLLASCLAIIWYFSFPRRLSIAESNPSSKWPEQFTDHYIPTEDAALERYKTLYLLLQNPERYPDILPEAWTELCGLLDEDVTTEKIADHADSILNLKNYDPKQLQAFIKNQHTTIMTQWEAYIHRKRAGGVPELFASRASAAEWLTRQAPGKLIDGAWLSHIHKISTPFYLRRVTKNAWQIYCEELGDGSLENNHVVVYRKLLRSLDVHLPDNQDEAFIHHRTPMNDFLCWKSAAAQLLISVFPHDFLPEILGFNLHFEQATLETLKGPKSCPNSVYQATTSLCTYRSITLTLDTLPWRWTQ